MLANDAAGGMTPIPVEEDVAAGCNGCVCAGCPRAAEMRLSIDERIPSMAARTAPWIRVCKFTPLVTCGQLAVKALDPCRVLAGAAVDTTTAVEPVGAGIWLVEGVDIFTTF